MHRRRDDAVPSARSPIGTPVSSRSVASGNEFGTSVTQIPSGRVIRKRARIMAASVGVDDVTGHAHSRVAVHSGRSVDLLGLPGRSPSSRPSRVGDPLMEPSRYHRPATRRRHDAPRGPPERDIGREGRGWGRTGGRGTASVLERAPGPQSDRHPGRFQARHKRRWGPGGRTVPLRRVVASRSGRLFGRQRTDSSQNPVRQSHRPAKRRRLAGVAPAAGGRRVHLRWTTD